MHLTSQAKVLRAVVCSLASLCASVSANDLVAGFEMADSSLSQTISQSSLLQASIQESIGITLLQNGTNNHANITQQSASSNHVLVSQNGANNLVDIVQFGSENTVNVSQHGDFSSLTVLQEGNGNLVNAEQFGSKTFLVQQIGDNMVVNITQL